MSETANSYNNGPDRADKVEDACWGSIQKSIIKCSRDK